MQSADPIREFIRGTILMAIFLAVVGWLMIRSLRRSDDPAQLLFKWALTVLVLGFMIWKVVPLVAAGGYAGAFGGIPLTAVCGVTLAAIWRRSLASIVARPFSDLFDGGDAEIEPQPFYSIAETQRNKGNYSGAIAEIHRQLEKFPTDLRGQMLLAEIQVENLKDLPAAEVTIQRLCNQPERVPSDIAYALNTLADWHLKFSQDPEAARQNFQTVIDRFPGTELAMLAAQRIAHLPTKEQLLSAHDPTPVAVPRGVDNLGLLRSTGHLKPADAEPEKLAAEYVKHLVEYPLDAEVREKLALLYAGHFQRHDLAVDQLEQLIQQPHQPARQVVHWLNLLADLHIKHAKDLAAAQQALQRIIVQYPDSAAAHNAQRRLDMLKRELKGSEKSQTLKLGTYEQNIGLKRKA